MRIRFKTEGGIAHFPGLSEPVTIDTDEMPQKETIELRRQVEEARFFDLPPQVAKPRRGAADYRQYTITVEDGERSHTLKVASPIESPELGRLVNTLDAKAKVLRRAARARDADPDSD